jgi:hypothetical protein
VIFPELGGQRAQTDGEIRCPCWKSFVTGEEVTSNAARARRRMQPDEVSLQFADTPIKQPPARTRITAKMGLRSRVFLGNKRQQFFEQSLCDSCVDSGLSVFPLFIPRHLDGFELALVRSVSGNFSCNWIPISSASFQVICGTARSLVASQHYVRDLLALHVRGWLALAFLLPATAAFLRRRNCGSTWESPQHSFPAR